MIAQHFVVLDDVHVANAGAPQNLMGDFGPGVTAGRRHAAVAVIHPTHLPLRE